MVKQEMTTIFSGTSFLLAKIIEIVTIAIDYYVLQLQLTQPILKSNYLCIIIQMNAIVKLVHEG